MNTVVIVEDDRDLATLLSLRLKKAGYEVIAEDNGNTGLQTVLRERPTAVILDWMMPGMTGIQVCEQIRHTDTLTDLPVLLLTAKTSVADVEVARNAGVDAVLSKPCSTAELLERLTCAIAARRNPQSGT
jgi:DNA-binding response OmpR family regulator